MWEVNGLQLECDLEDVETAGRVEKALKKMSETKVERTDSMVEAIEFQCQAIKTLFSDVFGEDTAEAIFKGVRLNRRLYTDVLYAFYDYMAEQRQAMVRRSNAISRYVPKK